MGKLNSGILGPVSGKIGGVVGARWKAQPYLRSYVVPGASRTTLQGNQRDRFKAVVAAGKYYVGRIFNPYYDKFLPRVSGFNRFITNNIPKAPDYTPITAYQVTDGPLYPGSALAGVYTTGTGALVVTWGTELGIDGAADDVAIAWGRNRLTNITYFSANTVRSAGTVTVSCATGITATDIDVGLFFAKMDGSLVDRISRNLSATASAA
ncbi:MAG: DUF6266 family protein [Sphaerochaeta sp.]|jgi:hypothetical protein|nr:DUF6266 family protein [Sphaerochaeta sp.]